MRHCYDISAAFSHIPAIMGLEMVMKRNKWEGKYYINREPHPRKCDKLRVWVYEGNILVGEQGGDTMTIQKWLVSYGGCADWREAYKVLDEQSPMRFKPFQTLERRREVKYITRDVLSQQKRPQTAKNSLYEYMRRMFGAEAVDKVWRMYDVGTDERGNTVYWYIDAAGRVCHDKIMAYRPDGHRDKRFGAWRRYKSADGYTARCLYGESLLPGWGGRVAVVESEKTALMCACLWDDVRFVATGGISNIGLSRKEWTLLPDIDGAESWKSHGEVSEWWSGWRNPPPKADIGDLIEAYHRAGRLDALRDAKEKALFNTIKNQKK